MGVLINEFEIVPPTSGEAGQQSTSAEKPSRTDAEKTLEPADVRTLNERFDERWLRTWAH